MDLLSETDEAAGVQLLVSEIDYVPASFFAFRH
jgi:hypothetical protein